MTFGSILEAVGGLARVALAAAALVIVPLADAATCALDEVAPVSEAAMDAPVHDHSTANHEDGDTGDTQHCAHGHCHHAGAFVDAGLGVVAQFDLRGGAVTPERVGLIRDMPGGLERPPKA